MGDRKAEMVFTDPPYNVSIQGFLAALGKVKHPLGTGPVWDATF